MVLRVVDEKSKMGTIDYIKKLNLNKKYTVNIEIEKKKRSLNQSNLYWLWLTCIQEETGNDKNLLHDHFRELYLPYTEHIVFGIPKKSLMSTTTLTTDIFKQYLDKIQVFSSSELGIELPNPDDLYFDQFKDFYSNKI